MDWQLDDEELVREVAAADVVLDCSDNLATRFALNRACWHAGTPLVSAAAIRHEGQIMTVLPGLAPCYRCLFPSAPEAGESCAREGILAPVAGVMGALQAVQAIEVLLDRGEQLRGRLLLFDALAMQWQQLAVRPSSACDVCGGGI